MTVRRTYVEDSGFHRELSELELPAGGGVGEVFGVFILAESELRRDAEDAAIGSHKERFNVAAIFGVVELSELLPDGAILDFFSGAFEDDGFVGFFSADNDVRIGGDVLCLASARASAEPEGVLPPDPPDNHEMRAAARTGCGNPIIV